MWGLMSLPLVGPPPWWLCSGALRGEDGMCRYACAHVTAGQPLGSLFRSACRPEGSRWPAGTLPGKLLPGRPVS